MKHAVAQEAPPVPEARPARSAKSAFAAQIRRHGHSLALAVVVLLVTAANIAWRLDETRPPHFDMGGHLWKSLLFRQYLSHHQLWHFVSHYVYYPPLIYWVGDAFYLVFGTAIWVSILSNIVFLSILTFSTYGLGSRLWSKRVGLLAAVFVVGSPMLVTQFKEYQTDAPLTAMVALGLYALVRANEFSNRRWSIFLGFAAGFGLLTKWTYPFALGLPVLIAVGVAVRHAVSARAFARLANCAYAALAALIVAGPWYVRNQAQLRVDIRRYTLNGAAYQRFNDPPVGSLRADLWYFWKLIDPQLYVPLLVFVAVGLAVAVWRREALRRNIYPLALVVGTYASFSLLRGKDTRYTLPLLSGIAILATYWVDYLPARLRRGAVTVIAGVSVAMFVVVSFGTRLLPNQIVVHTSFQDVALFAQRGYIIGPPTQENWHQEQIIRDIARASPGGGVIYEGSSTLWFNTEGALYYMLRNGLYEVWDPNLANVVLERGRISSVPRGFKALKRYKLPDGTVVTIGRRQAA